MPRLMVGTALRILRSLGLVGVLGAAALFSGCGTGAETITAEIESEGGSSADGDGDAADGDGDAADGDGDATDGDGDATGVGGDVAYGTSAGAVGATAIEDTDSTETGFPPGIDLSVPGPFETTTGSWEGPNCTVYRPVNMGEGGVRHPVVIWANGTGAITPLYSGALRHWASYGFVVVAGNLVHFQGTGNELLRCLTYVCEEYAADVDCIAGASGHSQGGGGAIVAGSDPRVVTTAPLQPFILLVWGGVRVLPIIDQTGPMLLLSGTLDAIASPLTNQLPVFVATNVPVFWANLHGGEHLSVAVNGINVYRDVMLAWFRLHLMGDEEFRDMFYDPCTLCGDSKWIINRRNMN
jgi:hypothetical protein